MVILWALFLTSFLAWPTNLSLPFFALQLLMAAAVSGFFIHTLWRLKTWCWQFGLFDNGDLDDSEGRHRVQRAWVLPLVCILLIKKESGQGRLRFVFADMLDDGPYRDLCRLLLFINARALKS